MEINNLTALKWQMYFESDRRRKALIGLALGRALLNDTSSRDISLNLLLLFGDIQNQPGPLMDILSQKCLPAWNPQGNSRQHPNTSEIDTDIRPTDSGHEERSSALFVNNCNPKVAKLSLKVSDGECL